MKGSVKRTGSRDENEMVGVQRSTEAEASSHQPRKRCRKAKIVEASSDQPQTGGRMAGVVEGSSHQTEKRGRKGKLTPDELKARKAVRESNRHKNMMDAVRVIREMGPQMEILKNKNAEFDTQLEKVNSELLTAVTQDMKTMKEDIEIVKNDYKKMGSLIEGFLQSKVEENDLMGLEIPPLDNAFLQGEENTLMVLGSCNHISNEVPGMLNQEIMAELKKMRDSYEESKRESEKRIEELVKENEKLKSRVTAMETDKSKDAKK